MTIQEVHQGRLRTPFFSRISALDTVNQWHEWKGYSSADTLYCEDTEYFAIRNATAVFDLTPMTKYRITGPETAAYINRLVTRDMDKIKPGRVAYAVWCDDRGQVIDDGTIFHLKEGEYRLCSQERHFAWLQAAAIGFDVSIKEETADIAALAVQGPTSFSVLSKMGLDGLAELKPFGLMNFDFDGADLMVSRTGFTGDLGYELWIEPAKAELLWDALFEAGKLHGIRAMGTHALELARIEAGYLAAYHDFLPADATVRTGRTRSPLELGLDWLVDFKKPNFNGRRALAEEKRRGSTWRLVKLDIEGNKAAHHSYIFAKEKGNKSEIGFVTSAAWSPVCKQNIAIGTVRTPHGKVGSTVWVEIYYQREMHWARAMAKATVFDKPFWFPPRRSATPPGPY
ncbi:MAG: aminomethyltransferase family protein [Gammaproteobacteria bacterium]|nr:aminomethyltransferase family protein [Gammaproteobacteria bacterium]MDH3408627.1 aminomethyltransferase family protein [Gammaproteobacteria bacterium]MDH3550982.1 aminomethyltransferase family protein [Gammaproteobacteria bacterium]